MMALEESTETMTMSCIALETSLRNVGVVLLLGALSSAEENNSEFEGSFGIEVGSGTTHSIVCFFFYLQQS